MKMISPAVLLAASLLAGLAPGTAFAKAPPQAAKPSPAARQAPREVATHATTGIVKTLSASAIVITRRVAGKRTDTSFVLTPSTQRAGSLAAGATVEIRYRTDGERRIATAVTAEPKP